MEPAKPPLASALASTTYCSTISATISAKSGQSADRCRRGKFASLLCLRSMLLAVPLLAAPLLSQADFMDSDWATQACEAWNSSADLTTGLAGDTWIDNNNDRGYKIIQIYRTDCGEETKIQLNIEPKDGKAMCTYGGEPDGKEFQKKYDYIMHATDKAWTCMGEGKFGCGAMGAMMSGKLKFVGPKMEAMSVMDPFNAFLRLTGSIEGEKAGCE